VRSFDGPEVLGGERICAKASRVALPVLLHSTSNNGMGKKNATRPEIRPVA